LNLLSALVGQEEISKLLAVSVTQLKTGAASCSVDSSWLFVGPRGSGLTHAAVAFAASLVCSKDGCGNCIDCTSVLNSTHVDVERFSPTSSSIQVDEVRELIARSYWAPAVCEWKIVIIEDVSRMTEAAANALLKTIEEPDPRKLWLLCAHSLLDVPVTIRSRCRPVQLRTPSTKSLEKFLLSSTNIDPKTAKLAAQICGGHIERARLIALDGEEQNRRLQLLSLLFSLKDVDSCYKAAQFLLEIAETQTESENVEHHSYELQVLRNAYQAISRDLIPGGSRAIRNLEKEQKSSKSRSIRHNLDSALLDLAMFYRDILACQTNCHIIQNVDFAVEIANHAVTNSSQRTIQQIEAILEARSYLARNAAPLTILEALFCALK
jgi:DNA polymerase-3 subunit delta'